MATLSTLQCFGFFWTPAAKAICLQELARCFRARLSPDVQNRASAKNGSCIQMLDRALMAAAQAAENHGNEWGLSWCLRWGIYTSIPTWAYSRNSLVAAEALNLKISSHGTSDKWSWRLSQSA